MESLLEQLFPNFEETSLSLEEGIGLWRRDEIVSGNKFPKKGTIKNERKRRSIRENVWINGS